MYTFLKPLQLQLVWSVLLLTCFSVCPALSSGGIDPKGTGSDTSPDRAFMIKKSSQRLIGTAVSRNPAGNFAIIEDIQTKQQWIYREGDLIGTALIRKIQPAQIIVDNGNGEEVVKLKRSLLENAAGTGFSGSGGKTAKSNSGYRSGSRDRHYLINGEVFAAAFANPEHLVDTVDMRPYNLLNQKKGVKFGAFSPDSIFTAFGLRKGDLLLTVDGQKIADPGQAVAMMQTMLDNGEAELKVRRRARTYRIHLQDLKIQ